MIEQMRVDDGEEEDPENIPKSAQTLLLRSLSSNFHFFILPFVSESPSSAEHSRDEAIADS